jgi:hypothetical protein
VERTDGGLRLQGLPCGAVAPDLSQMMGIVFPPMLPSIAPRNLEPDASEVTCWLALEETDPCKAYASTRAMKFKSHKQEAKDKIYIEKAASEKKSCPGVINVEEFGSVSQSPRSSSTETDIQYRRWQFDLQCDFLISVNN